MPAQSPRLKPVTLRLAKTRDFFATIFWGDGHRFADAFRQVLGRLPEDAYRLLVTHWHPVTRGIPNIRIEAAPFIPADKSAVAFGLTEDLGKTLRFWGPPIEGMPEVILRSLIAHELGHAHVMAAFDRGLLDPVELAGLRRTSANPSAFIALHEAMADLRMIAWGYDAQALRQWINNYDSSSND